MYVKDGLQSKCMLTEKMLKKKFLVTWTRWVGDELCFFLEPIFKIFHCVYSNFTKVGGGKAPNLKHLPCQACQKEEDQLWLLQSLDVPWWAGAAIAQRMKHIVSQSPQSQSSGVFLCVDLLSVCWWDVRWCGWLAMHAWSACKVHVHGWLLMGTTTLPAFFSQSP